MVCRVPLLPANMNTSDFYYFIQEIVADDLPLLDSMLKLIKLCEDNVPGNHYPQLRNLDYHGDVQSLTHWLRQLLSDKPPPDTIKAFWFGLYNPVLDDDNPICQLYISGSTQFGENDLSGDWAVWQEDSYIPEGRYANSDVLATLYRVTEHTDAEYITNLGYACLAVCQMCEALPPDLMLGSTTRRDVAVGFDSGDPLLVGYITRDGFQRRSPES